MTFHNDGRTTYSDGWRNGWLDAYLGRSLTTSKTFGGDYSWGYVDGQNAHWHGTPYKREVTP